MAAPSHAHPVAVGRLLLHAQLKRSELTSLSASVAACHASPAAAECPVLQPAVTHLRLLCVKLQHASCHTVAALTGAAPTPAHMTPAHVSVCHVTAGLRAWLEQGVQHGKWVLLTQQE